MVPGLALRTGSSESRTGTSFVLFFHFTEAQTEEIPDDDFEYRFRVRNAIP